MKQWFALTTCLALSLALSGCGKKEAPKPNPAPSAPAPSASAKPKPDPEAEAKAKAKAEAEAKAKAAALDDHSDDPWYDGDVAGAPAGDMFGMALGALGIKSPPGTPPSPAAASPPGGKQPVGSASAWEPDKSLLGQLEPYQDVEGYQIRLPKGYTLTQLPMTPPAGTKLFFWMGPRQPDGNGPFVQVTLTAIPPQEGMESARALANVLAGAQDALKRQNREWKPTPAETGQINGLAALRIHYRAVLPNGAAVRGLMYAVVDGSTVISVGGAVPEGMADALNLAEAAALTFRKK